MFFFFQKLDNKLSLCASQVSEGYKFVYIAWCGEGVSGMLRGNLANHATDFENFLTVTKELTAIKQFVNRFCLVVGLFSKINLVSTFESTLVRRTI